MTSPSPGPETHRPETHRVETHRPETHRSETHRSETPSPVPPGSVEPDPVPPDPVQPGSVPNDPGSVGPRPTDRPDAMPTIWEQMGGPMGIVDSALPVVVFVVVNSFATLGWAIAAALGAGVLIAGIRLARRRPVTQAIAGLFGVGIAAFIAYRTGSAKGYFLFGIWSYVVYGGALLLSILVRWPLVGVLWESINGRGTAWRADRRLVRRYDLATAIWVLVFALRFAVQNELYDNDQVGWLATARILMGTPLWIVAILATIVIVGSAGGMRLPDRLRRRS